MKTFLLLKKKATKIIFTVSIGLFFQQAISAQSLSFVSPVLESGDALQIGSQYRFSDVAFNVDALVTVDDLVNGAEIRRIDYAEGLGFDEAFQPSIYSPAGTASSYALFSVVFVSKGTKTPVTIGDFAATIVDLDGNSTLKEFSEITIGGSFTKLKYTTTSTSISVTSITDGYTGRNTSGAEVSGIDTASKLSMFTVQKLNVGSFNLKVGATTVGASSQTREHSIYFRDFTYSNISGFSTLPVKMYSFNASLNNTKVDLKWVTASEVNASHFIVEKSTDGINFNAAGLVYAYGSTTDKATYTLSDNINANQNSVIYYRIRSVDVDGKNELSETRIIRINNQADSKVSIVTYPNPVSSEVRITIPANWQNKKVVYEIFNASGKTAKKTETTNSNQTETVNVSNLAPGFYIVRVKMDGQTAQQKIIKQ